VVLQFAISDVYKACIASRIDQLILEDSQCMIVRSVFVD